MNKRYLLIIKNKFSIDTLSFYTASCKWSATNQLRKGLIFYWKETFYFILRSLVIKYGKDNVINTVNNIVINNVKEDE